MNRRLLLALYDRSGLGAYMPVDYNGHELEVAEHMEKFVELIVKECAMIVEGFEITQEVALDEYVDYEASDVLKKHFGIE